MSKNKWLISDVFCIDDVLKKVKKKKKRLKQEKKALQKEPAEN